jgi:hypothetical protein
VARLCNRLSLPAAQVTDGTLNSPEAFDRVRRIEGETEVHSVPVRDERLTHSVDGMADSEVCQEILTVWRSVWRFARRSLGIRSRPETEVAVQCSACGAAQGCGDRQEVCRLV